MLGGSAKLVGSTRRSSIRKNTLLGHSPRSDFTCGQDIRDPVVVECHNRMVIAGSSAAGLVFIAIFDNSLGVVIWDNADPCGDAGRTSWELRSRRCGQQWTGAVTVADSVSTRFSALESSPTTDSSWSNRFPTTDSVVSRSDLVHKTSVYFASTYYSWRYYLRCSTSM